MSRNRPVRSVGSAVLVIVVAAAALVGMVAIPAMLIWVVAVSVAMWRGPRFREYA